MALWFAGASSTPKSSRNEFGSGVGVRRVVHSEGCLELGSLEAQVPYRAHGRKKATPSEHQYHVGDADDTVTVKVGLKIVQRPETNGKTYEKLFTAPPPPAQPCPFAGDTDAAVPYKKQKKGGIAEHHENLRDGDAFVLRKSRTPPVTARLRSTEEGFCVILPTSVHQQRGSAQMIRAERMGKGTTQFDKVVSAKREFEEQKQANAHHSRCIAAQKAELSRVDRQAHDEARIGGRSRIAKPCDSTTAATPPFALDLPSRNDFVGVSLASRRCKTPR